jgi:hypothetical protein
MSKKLFAYGDTLDADWLNKVFHDATTPGARHDGAAEDGNLPQINLSADAGAVKQEVTGTLPLANMATHAHNGTQASKVNLSAAAEVQGTLPLANMATHAHNGTQASKVNLSAAAEVQGTLPLANMATHAHNGTQATKVDLTAAAEVQGTLPLANMATHAHNGTQATKINLANASEVQGALPWANVVPPEVFTFEMTSGASQFGTPQSFNVAGLKFGRLIVLYFPTLVATAGSTAQCSFTSTTILAADKRPFANMETAYTILCNNNLDRFGLVQFMATGVDTQLNAFFLGESDNGIAQNFATTGSKGFNRFTMCYFSAE